MFLDGTWHTIALGEAAANVAATDRLDVSRLQDLIVLKPLLGIDDERSSKRIDFVGGLRGTGELERAVQSGRAAVAFSMYPVSVDDLMTIAITAESCRRSPPGSSQNFGTVRCHI